MPNMPSTWNSIFDQEGLVFVALHVDRDQHYCLTACRRTAVALKID
jgi:hypothetical protein